MRVWKQHLPLQKDKVSEEKVGGNLDPAPLFSGPSLVPRQPEMMAQGFSACWLGCFGSRSPRAHSPGTHCCWHSSSRAGGCSAHLCPPGLLVHRAWMFILSQRNGNPRSSLFFSQSRAGTKETFFFPVFQFPCWPKKKSIATTASRNAQSGNIQCDSEYDWPVWI